MFEEFIGKRVKIVIRDGDAVKALRGKFIGVEADKFIKLELDRSGIQAFNIDNVEKIRLDEESNGKSYRDRNY